MLSIPELAMNPNKQIITECCGKKHIWNDREEAKEYFLEMMMSAEGEIHDRCEAVFMQIMNGLTVCKD